MESIEVGKELLRKLAAELVPGLSGHGGTRGDLVDPALGNLNSREGGRAVPPVPTAAVGVLDVPTAMTVTVAVAPSPVSCSCLKQAFRVVAARGAVAVAVAVVGVTRWRCRLLRLASRSGLHGFEDARLEDEDPEEARRGEEVCDRIRPEWLKGLVRFLAGP